MDDDDVMDVSKATRKAKRSAVVHGLLLHTMYGFTAADVPQYMSMQGSTAFDNADTDCLISLCRPRRAADRKAARSTSRFRGVTHHCRRAFTFIAGLAVRSLHQGHMVEPQCMCHPYAHKE